VKLLIFTKRGCPTCALFLQTMIEWMDERHKSIPVMPVEVESEPVLARKYGVTLFPAMVMLDENKLPVATHSGLFEDKRDYFDWVIQMAIGKTRTIEREKKDVEM